MTASSPTQFGALDGKTAIVTGSSSGIGREIALELARGGANLVLHCAKSVDRMNRVRQEIESMGREVKTIQANFLQAQGVESFLDQLKTQNVSPDILVNNAGIDLLTGEQKHWDFQQKWDALIKVDVKTCMQLSKTIGQQMVEQGSGVILNIGWDQAERGMEGDSGELFAASKNAIMGFSRSLALSLAPVVRVNCIAPGWIRTAWGDVASEQWQQRVINETPLKRWGEPADIANLARFLVSDSASYLTGQVIYANGGAER